VCSCNPGTRGQRAQNISRTFVPACGKTKLIPSAQLFIIHLLSFPWGFAQLCAMLANACPREPRSSPGICRLAGASVSELSDVFFGGNWGGQASYLLDCCARALNPRNAPIVTLGARALNSRNAPIVTLGARALDPRNAPIARKWRKREQKWPSGGASLGQSGTESVRMEQKLPQLGCQTGAKWHRK
jgi:hypothetical protein